MHVTKANQTILDRDCQTRLVLSLVVSSDSSDSQRSIRWGSQ